MKGLTQAQTQSDLDKLMRIGKIVAGTLEAMRQAVAPGITTKELDDIAARYLGEYGARSAPQITYNYPGVTCISINEEAAHGIPGKRVLKSGDLVKLDVSAELDGFFGDAAITVGVGEISPEAQRLMTCAQEARDACIQAATADVEMRSLGKASEDVIRRYGYNVIRELPGHGIGHALHQDPRVLHFYFKRATEHLADGTVMTVEPHVAAGSGLIVQEGDGWTLRTKDRSPVAVFEHTIVVTRGKPILVTAL